MRDEVAKAASKPALSESAKRMALRAAVLRRLISCRQHRFDSSHQSALRVVARAGSFAGSICSSVGNIDRCRPGAIGIQRASDRREVHRFEFILADIIEADLLSPICCRIGNRRNGSRRQCVGFQASIGRRTRPDALHRLHACLAQPWAFHADTSTAL